MQLTEKVAIITGAGSGIGRELTTALVARGATVVAVGRRPDKLNETARAASIPERVLMVAADVGKREDLQRIVETTMGRYGHIDIVINNAGVGYGGMLEEHSLDDVDHLMQINLISPIFLTRLTLPILKAQNEGVVVNISSMSGLVPVPFQSPYVASKEGLRGFSRSLGRELSGTKVRVLCVYPGSVDTEMISDRMRLKAKEMGRYQPAMAPSWKVAAAVVRAMEQGKTELVAAYGKERLLPIFEALAPGLLTRQFSKISTQFRALMQASRAPSDRSTPPSSLYRS